MAEEEACVAYEEARVTEEVAHWSCEAGELAACFTVHARDLFGYACVVSGADSALAGETCPDRVRGGRHGLVDVARAGH